MQQVDVGHLGLVGEVAGDGDGEALGVGRAGFVVGPQAGVDILLLHHLGVGGHDLRGLAVQGEGEAVGQFGALLPDLLQPAHDELEVGVVVALVGGRHQELRLVAGPPVQSV